jgi:dipeptidase D
MSSLESLEPKSVWQIFAGLAAVPRPSKNEQRVRDHVTKLARTHNLPCRTDGAGNLILQAPASPGAESSPITILQAHLDMVCEKNSDTQFDFENQGIRTLIDKDRETGEPIVRADGTTLGADNGIGVAMALAASTTPGLRRPPLELLLTIDEEAGMSGAKGLEPAGLRGRRLLNLDSEEDDALYIGCAGGCDTSLIWSLPLSGPPAGVEAAKIHVTGLRGGHSGTEIHLNRGSAVKLLTRVLLAAGNGLQIAEISAGSKRNAIPREAMAQVTGPNGVIERLSAAAREAQSDAITTNREADCRIAVESWPSAANAVSAPDTHRFLLAISGLPHGVQAVVPEIPGLVETSNSVSTISTRRWENVLRVVAGCLSRSSSASALATLVTQIRSVGQLAGAAIDQGNSYPGWQPNIDSPTLAACKKVYERLFDQPPRVTAIHAGLECGILGERVPGLDMVSLGPHIAGPHSPDERVYIHSVQKSWKFLTGILADLAK